MSMDFTRSNTTNTMTSLRNMPQFKPDANLHFSPEKISALAQGRNFEALAEVTNLYIEADPSKKWGTLHLLVNDLGNFRRMEKSPDHLKQIIEDIRALDPDELLEQLRQALVFASKQEKAGTYVIALDEIMRNVLHSRTPACENSFDLELL